MTSRVVECQVRDGPAKRSSPRARQSEVQKAPGFRPALFAALVVVPLVGARGQAPGWIAGSLTAATVLVLHGATRGRAHWGWLTALLLGAELVTPRTERAWVEPVLWVGTVLSGVLWIAGGVGAGADEAEQRPPPGSPERAAQEQIGRYGEIFVGSFLARELPDEYVLVNGLKLRHSAGDIDHLVVGPTGVFLVETKTMAGRIVCNSDGTWQRTRRGRSGAYAAYIGDPALQVQRNIQSVRRCLEAGVPGLFRSGSPLWIEGLIVFPHPRTELETSHSRVPAVRLEDAVQTICQHVPRRSLRPPEVEGVVEALLNTTGALKSAVAQPAQAVLEMVLALPIILGLLFGILAVSRVVQAQSSLVAVVHESARAGALGFSPADAERRARDRADQVADSLQLDRSALTVEVDARRFARNEGSVFASGTYRLQLNDLPLVSWAGEVRLSAEHVEWVDPFRSGLLATSVESP